MLMAEIAHNISTRSWDGLQAYWGGQGSSSHSSFKGVEFLSLTLPMVTVLDHPAMTVRSFSTREHYGSTACIEFIGHSNGLRQVTIGAIIPGLFSCSLEIHVVLRSYGHFFWIGFAHMYAHSLRFFSRLREHNVDLNFTSREWWR